MSSLRAPCVKLLYLSVVRRLLLLQEASSSSGLHRWTSLLSVYGGGISPSMEVWLPLDQPRLQLCMRNLRIGMKIEQNIS